MKAQTILSRVKPALYINHAEPDQSCYNLNTFATNNENINKFNQLIHLKKHPILINGQQYLLSTRQFECLKLLANGLSIKMIANELQITTRTCQYYIDIIKDKLNCYSKAELLRLINKKID